MENEIIAPSPAAHREYEGPNFNDNMPSVFSVWNHIHLSSQLIQMNKHICLSKTGGTPCTSNFSLESHPQDDQFIQVHTEQKLNQLNQIDVDTN
jgi:hypothetical protein